MQETSTWQNLKNILMWWLKQLRDFILKYSVSGGFFWEKEILNVYTKKLVSFHLAWCVDEVVVNQTNYEGYKYMFICFSITHLQSSVSWMVKEFLTLSEEQFLMDTFI